MKTEERTGRRWRGLLIALGVLAGLTLFVLLLKAILPCDSYRHAQTQLDTTTGVVVAFFVGVVSFFSPCILPLLPGYISFVSGMSAEETDARAGRRRVLLGTTLFVLGFASIYTVLGASSTLIGRSLGQHQSVLERVAGVIVVVMGLAFLIPGAFRFMERERRPLMARAKPGVGGAYPLGVAFAIGWVPCVGPGLSAVLTIASTQGSAARGSALLFSFSLGFGVWFILGGIAIEKAVVASAFMRRNAKVVQVIGGGLMIVVGALLLLGRWGSIVAPIRTLLVTLPGLC